MKGWEFTVELDPGGDLPVFLQIARALAAAIRGARLRPGDPLPSSRSLATRLGVHRNTVLAAFDELRAEGWIEALPARRTQVAMALPSPRAAAGGRRGAEEGRGEGRAREPGFEVPAMPLRPRPPTPPAGAMVLAGGAPDLRLVPKAALARAYRRALLRRGDQLLEYGDPQGLPELRAEVAAMLRAERGLSIGTDELIITRGSQMALALAAQVLLRPGDVVAVEAMGYRPAWDALAATGAELVPVAVDEDGLDVEALAALARRRRLRAVYLTPHHQFPTTALLAAPRRLRLLEMAAAGRFAVLEDDYDNELHYAGRPVLPLGSADRAGVVVYLGTLSKILAPGLRVGFLVAPPAIIARAAALRERVDRQGDLVVEAALAELFEDGEVLRHARRMRRIYLGRRDALVAALAARLAGAVSCSPPQGGMALWARVDPAIDVDAWAERAAAAGVVVATGRAFAFDGLPRPGIRIGFGRWREEELRLAVDRLAAALDAGRGRASPGARSRGRRRP